jgi:hypothetical protein
VDCYSILVHCMLPATRAELKLEEHMLSTNRPVIQFSTDEEALERDYERLMDLFPPVPSSTYANSNASVGNVENKTVGADGAVDEADFFERRRRAGSSASPYSSHRRGGGEYGGGDSSGVSSSASGGGAVSRGGSGAGRRMVSGKNKK